MNKHCSILTITNRSNYIENIFSNFYSQDYDNLELVIVLNNNTLSKEKYESYIKDGTNIQVIVCDDKLTLGECKNIGLKSCKYDYIAFFDDDDYYGPKFISDTLSIFDKKRCDIVGKTSFYVYFESSKTLSICLDSAENKYVHHVADSSMILKRKVIEKVKFPSIQGSGTITAFQKTCIINGFKIHSTNRHHFVAHRHPNPKDSHTWTIADKEFMIHCKTIAKDIDDYKIIVDI